MHPLFTVKMCEKLIAVSAHFDQIQIPVFVRRAEVRNQLRQKGFRVYDDLSPAVICLVIGE